MTLDQFLLFLSVTFLMSASPGPVMLSCMAYAGRHGFGKSLYAMLGASCGNLVLMLLSALGLGLLVEQAETIFHVIKWLGAAYLIYLGVQMFRATIATTQAMQPTIPVKALLQSSFIIAITNPKGFIYFGALFPQFIDTHKPMLPQFALLTFIFLSIDLVWMIIYAKGGSYIMQWLHKPSHQRWFNRLSGGALIATGIAMALTKF